MEHTHTHTQVRWTNHLLFVRSFVGWVKTKSILNCLPLPIVWVCDQGILLRLYTWDAGWGGVTHLLRCNRAVILEFHPNRANTVKTNNQRTKAFVTRQWAWDSRPIASIHTRVATRVHVVFNIQTYRDTRFRTSSVMTESSHGASRPFSIVYSQNDTIDNIVPLWLHAPLGHCSEFRLTHADKEHWGNTSCCFVSAITYARCHPVSLTRNLPI